MLVYDVLCGRGPYCGAAPDMNLGFCLLKFILLYHHITIAEGFHTVLELLKNV